MLITTNLNALVNNDMHDFTINPSDLILFSILVTEKCNCSCSYCHFYARNKYKDGFRDIEAELFDSYLELVKHIKSNFHNKVQVRFSGGEPLCLSDRLFELSNKLFFETGIKPYILTNGTLLTDDFINNALKNNVAAFVISLENPFDIDSGSTNPFDLLKLIKEYQNSPVPLIPGSVIVRNNQFNRIFDICDFFYNEINELPTIIELNFTEYQSPSDEELRDLYQNIYSVVKKYSGKTPIQLFPYIMPETLLIDELWYLVELDVRNSMGIDSSDLSQSTNKIQGFLSNRTFSCENSKCEWHSNCGNILHIWKEEKDLLNKGNKMNDYCRFKRTLSASIFNALQELDALT